MFMKKLLLLLLPILVGANLLLNRADHENDNKKVNLGDIAPDSNHSKVGMLVTQIFSQYHYKKTALTDSLSSHILDQYIKDLDFNRLYFVASDIEKFEKYRYELDDDLKDGKLDAAYDIFNIYKQRVNERNAYVAQLLQKEFDYTTDEYYESNREKASWSKTDKELNDIWRKQIKSQALSLKLSGKKWDETTKLLGDRYKNIDKFITQSTSEDVFQTYMNAFAENIDPHTSYLSPNNSASFKIEMSKTLEGIGATLQTENDYTKVNDIVPGGPAHKSGLIKKGDKIAGVAQGEDGKFVDVIGWRIDEVVKLIRGPKGTTVRLQIIPAEAGPEHIAHEIKIVRDKIKLEDQVAKKEIVPVTQNGKTYKLGVITIPNFYMDFDERQKGVKNYTSTTNDVRRLIGELKAQNINGLVIDLRNNGGGLLTEAVDLTGLFIADGPVVQVRNTNGSVDVLKDSDSQQVYDGPLAVMVNRFSASASEIFAGAIQDYKRGLIIGEQTYGKGTVQSQLDLNRFIPDQEEKLGQVNLTIAKFYRVTGSSTQHKGVTPDIELPALYSAAEFGESSQPNALPWDQIKSSNFKPYQNITESLVAKLESNYEKRMKTDTELKNFAQTVDEAKKARENTKVSLQESKRRKEREEAEKRLKLDAFESEESSSEAAPKEKTPAKKDVYLKETTRVVADMLVAK